MKVLFMGTPAFAAASLAALIEAGHEVLAAVTRPDAPSGRGLRLHPCAVKELSLGKGIPVLHPGSLRSPEFLSSIRAMSCDLLVVAAYGRLLPPSLLELPSRGAINVHASILPKYRGAAPIARAIAGGERVTGVTIMKVVEALDAGPIIAAKETPIGDEETAGKLEVRLAELGAKLLVETMASLPQGKVGGISQDESRATWAPPLAKDEGRVVWAEPSEIISRKVRAFDPWPGAQARLAGVEGARFILWKARAAEPVSSEDDSPGLVLEARASGDGALRVACGAGALLIEQLQCEGKRRMSAAAAVSGRYVKAGDRLGNG